MGFTDQWMAYTKTLTQQRDDLVASRDVRKEAELSDSPPPYVGVPAHADGGKAVVPTVYYVDPSGTVWASEYPGNKDGEESLNKDDDGSTASEKLTLEGLRAWTEEDWAKQLEKRGASMLLTSRVLEVPVFEEISFDSVSLAFDLKWPQLTRCNGLTGRQILTDSLLVPLSPASTYGVSLLTDSRQSTHRIALQQDEATLEAQRLSKFLRDSGCGDPMAGRFYLSEAGSFEEAVALAKEDREWGERHAGHGGIMQPKEEEGDGGKLGHHCCVVS
jgi:hypothetical protein